MDLKTYQRLKSDLDDKQREANEAKGAYDQSMRQIKEEFECSTLDEARKELERLEKKEREAEREYEDKLASFQKKWSDVVKLAEPRRDGR